MQNKELMLISSKTVEPHILLTVDSIMPPNATFYGFGIFFDYRFGKVSRRPFWRTASGNISLDHLYYAYPANNTVASSDSTVSDSVRITISTLDSSAILILESGAFNKVTGDLLNLKASLGKLSQSLLTPRRVSRSIIPTKRLWRNP